MGRKKIKIRPIKDDRNRAVTFLKRKNGLFKKAFELAVLCRAEVAVIVFAGNKKLYEFASSDMKDVLYRYTNAPEPYEHRGPEDFANKEDGDSDSDDDGAGLDISPDYSRMPSHTPQPHSTPQFGSHHLPMSGHNRRTSDDSILSDRRHSLQHPQTPQLLPHRTPPLHNRQHSLGHLPPQLSGTPPQQFQVPIVPGHGSPQPTTSAVRGQLMGQGMQHEAMGLGIGMNTPQPYGLGAYNPYSHQQVYLSSQEPPPRPSSTPNYPYQQNPYQPSPPPMHHQPPPQQHQELPQPPIITEIKSSNKGRMKSIHTPVNTRASSLAALFDNSSSSARHDRPVPSSRSLSVDSAGIQQPHQSSQPLNQSSSMPMSSSPPPIATTTPGSTGSGHITGQRPKLSLHIPDDDEDPIKNPPTSSPVQSATPATASPEIVRPANNSGDTPSQPAHLPDRQESFFLPPPTSASSLGQTSGLGGRGFGATSGGLGAYDNSQGGGTPLSALPSRYAGDMLPSPSTFYPEFYGNLGSATGGGGRSGFSGLMNGTPVVARADEAYGGNGGGNGGNGNGGEKRRGEEVTSSSNKRART